MMGPTIQDDLFSILWFTKHKYIMTADLEEMYRQIRIPKDQRNFQRIVCRSDSSEAIKY